MKTLKEVIKNKALLASSILKIKKILWTKTT